eukprot:4075809-Pyramimonas_sp.AAC.1
MPPAGRSSENSWVPRDSQSSGSPPQVSFAVANVLALRPRRRAARRHGTRIRCRCQDAAGLNLPGRMLALAH